MNLYILDIANDSYFEGWRSALDKSSLSRLSRINNQVRAKTFIGARLILKNVLREYLAKETSLIEVDNGVPVTVEPNSWRYSISHSGNYIGVIFDEQPIAIDIEVPKQRNFLDIATYAFSDEEILHLKLALDEPTLTNEFYKIWTLREALYKLSSWGPFERSIGALDYVKKSGLFCSFNCAPINLAITIVGYSKTPFNQDITVVFL